MVFVCDGVIDGIEFALHAKHFTRKWPTSKAICCA